MIAEQAKIEKLEAENAALRRRVDELQGANNDEVERRRRAGERAAFLAELQPWEWVAVQGLVEQYRRVIAKWPPLSSAHEGYGLMCEEVAELLEEIRKPAPYDRRVTAEARDVAVVALRMMLECQ